MYITCDVIMSIHLSYVHILSWYLTHCIATYTYLYRNICFSYSYTVNSNNAFTIKLQICLTERSDAGPDGLNNLYHYTMQISAGSKQLCLALCSCNHFTYAILTST